MKRRSRLRHLGLGAYLTAAAGARLARLYIPRPRDCERGGGKRGSVVTFSRQSRARMMEKLHRVRRDEALPLFVTLTFPDHFPDQREAKRLLDSLFKRWRRAWPECSAIWRMEIMDRKSGENAGKLAPHFHLLVWGCMEAEAIARQWCEVNGTENDPAHMRHGTAVERMKSWRGAASYCAKYCAKESDFPIEGRAWGVHNRASLPIVRPEEDTRIELVPHTCWRVARAMRALVRSRNGRRSFTNRLFTESPESWMRQASREVDAEIEAINSVLQIICADELSMHLNQCHSKAPPSTNLRMRLMTRRTARNAPGEASAMDVAVGRPVGRLP